ncbi:hypothetical protein [Spirosoma validum]|uniref:Lipocalin-like domain-containing protein n=1 Tax=Spirosoma validum TaxID=2771355 RepID=A0A927B827_9BACT|nr:hypothetical protein [Spirosoma validum]MBD2756917.1 hypothetical protein [Spirosoma validum]
MRFTLITLILIGLIGCNGKSVEKETSNRFVGNWQPVAFFIAPTKVYGNLKPGWNLDNTFPAVSFREDGTFHDPHDITNATIRYQVLNEQQFHFTNENNQETVYQYEFRADTLVTLTECANQLYCGWKYIPKP